MRITSTTYPNMLITSAQSAQQQMAQLQQEISTGNSVQLPSDNPVVYEEAEQTQAGLVQQDDYSDAITQATSMTTQNNNAMTSVYNILSEASDLVTSVNGTMSTSDMQSTATEMSSLLTELVSVVNQTQSGSGNYLFGGTSDQQPLNPTTLSYNYSTNDEVQTITVGNNTSVQVGLLAGRPGDPPVNGFLYNSTTGVNVISALQNAISDLNAGNATAVQSTDVPALDAALNNVSQYVGSSSADMGAVSAASTLNQQQTLNLQDQLGSLTQANLSTVAIQLQEVQNQYQASLEAGSRVMSLSLLNYMDDIPST